MRSLNLYAGQDDRPPSLLSDVRVRLLLLFQLHCSHPEYVHISLGKRRQIEEKAAQDNVRTNARWGEKDVRKEV